MALSDSRDITAAPGAPPGMLSRQGPPAWSGQCFHCVRSLDLNNSDGPPAAPPSRPPPDTRRGREGVGRGAPRPPPWRGHGRCWTPGRALPSGARGQHPPPTGAFLSVRRERLPGGPCSEPHGGLGWTRHRPQLAMVTLQAKSPGLGGPRRHGGGLRGARRAALSGRNGAQARCLMMCVTSTQSQ